MPPISQDLNRLPLGRFPALFASLPVPVAQSLTGVYRAAFVGPAWLRAAAAPALAITGLGGWWGKQFFEDGAAVNLVWRAGALRPIFPMRLSAERSFIDQKDGLALRYQPGSPFPWMFIVDELRRLDSNTLLGMTLADARGLRGLAFPFILQKENQP